MLAVRIAGCAYSVSTSRSSGPSKHKRESAIPSRSSASANVRRATGKASAKSRPIPTRCDPWPGKRQTTRAWLTGGSRGRPRASDASSVSLGLDDLSAAVGPAVWAGPVAQCRLATLRTGDDVGRNQRVVRATLVALARRRSALGYGHLFLLRVRSLPAHERVQDGEPPVGRHLLAVARTRVQVCAAA